MKHVLLDTNILMDACFRRKPDGHPSMELIRQCQLRRFEAYTTFWSIMTVMYLMDEARDMHGRRIATKQEIMTIAAGLMAWTTVIDTTNGHFATGFALGWSDWEDAVIYAAADAHPLVESVVTNDRKFATRTARLPGIKAVLAHKLLN